MSTRRPHCLIVLLIVLFVAGSAAPVALAEPSSSNTLPVVAIPETPAGMQLAWAIEQINGDAAALGAADVGDHVSADFLAALSAADLIATFQNLAAPLAPVTVARFEGGVSPTRANALLYTASGQPWRVQLGVDPSPPHLINDLFFEPVVLPEPVERPPKSWKGLDSRLKAVAPEVGFVAAEVTDGTCTPLNEVNAGEPLAIASAIKLYVLGTLADAVAAGEIGWDDPLPINQDLRSLPNGEMRLEADGSVFPVRAYAEQMMAGSDNTATDHLIALLGRERVEAYMAEMGHQQPGLNRPFLLTREWFALKLRYTEDELADYLDLSEAEKRRFLAEEVDPVAGTLSEVEQWLGPNEIETIEWFASAGDLCRAMASLHTHAQQGNLAPVYDALSLNPGVAWDAETWRYVGFKEGYETGVKSYAWLLQRADGRWFALTAIINDPKEEIEGFLLRQLMVTAVDLLAKTV
ncbi:MAG: serine hydrolase [Thermomicrobiales bacterium]